MLFYDSLSHAAPDDVWKHHCLTQYPPEQAVIPRSWFPSSKNIVTGFGELTFYQAKEITRKNKHSSKSTDPSSGLSSVTTTLLLIKTVEFFCWWLFVFFQKADFHYFHPLSASILSAYLIAVIFFLMPVKIAHILWELYISTVLFCSWNAFRHKQLKIRLYSYICWH